MKTKHMTNPTWMKMRNRGLVPIRYGYRRGWIVREDRRGMTVHLCGDQRNRRLDRHEAKFVETVLCQKTI